MLVSQKQLCDEMISEKEKLIDELQEDLKQKDDQYVKDLRKQVNLFAIEDRRQDCFVVSYKNTFEIYFIYILILKLLLKST